MQGIALYRPAQGGDIRHLERNAPTRKRLEHVLEDAVPSGGVVLGIVLVPDEGRHLHLIQPERRAS
ncbi:hypothetical protein [Frondihabitans cladoniiphilus]|uniref:Uncharacterized protein n=1 Tax=Frondihabitans cladoniiphilus TaxID=715785 RepID=A0ABP8VS09_9MICO